MFRDRIPVGHSLFCLSIAKLCSLKCQLCIDLCGQLAGNSLLSNEFSFKEMKTLGQSKISSYCLCLWCKSRELKGRGSPKFPAAMVESFSPDHLKAIKIYWPETHLELYIASVKSRSVREHLTSLLFWISCLTFTHTRLACLPKMSQSWVFYEKLLERVAYGILSNINDGATLRKYVERL